MSWDLEKLEKRLVYHVWPVAKQATDENWVRTWDIELTRVPAVDTTKRLEAALAERGLMARIDVSGTRAKVTVATDEHLTSEEQILSFVMLQMLNDLLSPIARIQDQPRDEWQPWLGGVHLVDIPASVDELPEA